MLLDSLLCNAEVPFHYLIYVLSKAALSNVIKAFLKVI